MTEFEEDKALIEMIQEGVCFFGNMWHPDKPCKPENFLGIGVFLNCNDLFYWGTADAEPFGRSDIEDIYAAWKEDRKEHKYKLDIWACKHRNLQPQKPIKNKMIEVGVWTDELDTLPAPAPS